MNIVLFSVVAGASAIISYVIYRKLNSTGPILTSNVEYETIERELTFDEMVAGFKLLQLNKNQDVPFIADQSVFKENTKTNSVFKKGNIKNLEIPTKEGYKVYVIGVYNIKKGEFPFFKILYCKDIDKKIKEIMGEEKLVTLS